MRLSTVVLGLCSLVVAPAPLGAHDDLLARIHRTSTQIEETGGTPELYLKRGEMYRIHGDWEKALADFQSAEAMDSTLEQLPFLRGRLWLKAGDPAKAIPHLDALLAKNPDAIGALIVRSRALAGVGRVDEAILDLNHSISLQRSVSPKLFLERARLYQRSGDVEGALAGLDEGIARLGPLVTLIGFALELELEAERYDQALGRIDSLQPALRSHPTWIARKGEVLVEAGRPDQALSTYKAALQALQALPSRRRTTKAFLQLKEEIDRRLEVLKGS